MTPSLIESYETFTAAPVDYRYSVRSRETLAFVIPTLCEAGNIRTLVGRACAALDPLDIQYELIVVDDDSRDGIEEIVAELQLEHPSVRILTRVGERGLSGAVLHGWQHTDATLLGVMDADLQHPPEMLPDLVNAALTGSDIVIGSRYAAVGSLGKWNPLRKLVSSAAVLLTWPIQKSSLRAKDPMSGFFLVRRNCLQNLSFQRSGFKLLLEILVRSQIESVAEVPFSFGRRYRGVSKASVKVAIDYALLLARLYKGKFFSSRHAQSAEAIAADMISVPAAPPEII
jgi:dolichol-phosphate mannosyltransferase